MPPVHIRPASAADCPALAAIDSVCNPSPWSTEQFASALAEKHTAVYLAETASGICGFIVWQQLLEESELHLIATAPAARRQGIAASLMSLWLQQSQASGVQRLMLEVRAGNQAAQTLYRRYGFHESGRRPAYYRSENGREDAVIMEKLC